ncbi:MAG: aromatic amino acid transaminase [Qingshengfaniella sp.]
MTRVFAAAPRLGADPIVSVMTAFRADPRPDKIDLGVGVYRDAAGQTPVFRAVAAAERQVLDSQTTKAYTALAGDEAYHRALGALALGPQADWSRLAALAAPGGTGALRHAAELIRACRPDSQFWLPEPTWPNHPAILKAMHLRYRGFRYYDAAHGRVDPEAMLADLAAVAPGDVVLLHGGCHNPTGADPDAETWAALADLCAQRGAIPLIDTAYQGFGRGLDADMAGPRHMLGQVPEALVALSCSKNFGLYRERAGLLLVQSAASDRNIVQDALAWQNRLAYAFPPDHGARVVTTILEDPALRQDWQDELTGMRDRIGHLRKALAEALRTRLNAARMDWLADGRGMFSLLPLSPDQVETLRNRHGIYMIPDGRINLAGAATEDMPRIADALADCGL